jgi:hypothetical protein
MIHLCDLALFWVAAELGPERLTLEVQGLTDLLWILAKEGLKNLLGTFI